MPLVVDTLEILGADNLAHGHIGNTRLVVRLPHSERRLAAACGYNCRQMRYTSSILPMESVWNECKNWPYPHIVAHRGGGKLAPENTGGD